ncbi:MFS transporter [Chryseotalea sanaruensis]|nr:MFS transporter [Chryseotalea sanaruensis]
MKQDYRSLYSVPVVVAALGYFVDIYDLLLFSIVRITSLRSLGVAEENLMSTGEFLIQAQMFGLLIGGIIWGIMGDKRGRLSVLFGSILLYSLANIGNGFVTTVDQYALLRFIAGIGLAGELGAGITLVSEVLSKELRGYGTTIVASVGLMGAVLANIVARTFDWQMAYFIGGGLGLLLLLARVSIFESGMYEKVKTKNVKRGNFLQLFTNRDRLQRFVSCIFIGLPIWFVIGILISFSPEFAKALGVSGTIIAGDAVMFSYIGLAVGDLSSGLISQWLKSRRKVVLLYILITLVFIVLYLFNPSDSPAVFYLICFGLGVGTGYWALFVTIAAEQFGTNLRSTVATSVPNFIRGTVVPLVALFSLLRPLLGITWGAFIVGSFTILISLIALKFLNETFARDLNFLEED